MAEIRRLAQREGIPAGEWVQRALRAALSRQLMNDPEFKLKAIRKAAHGSFPTADLDQMLVEIEQGYRL